MSNASRRIASVASAFGLAALTLAVFYVAQNAGPQTAVLRFHEALRADDPAALQSVLLQSIQASPAVRVLAEEALVVLHAKGEVQIVRTSPLPQPGVVIVETRYRVPGSQPITRAWVVVHSQSGWKIDADASVRLFLTPISPG